MTADCAPSDGAAALAAGKEVGGLRCWFVLYALWLTGLCGLALGAEELSGHDAALAQRIWLGAVYVFYLSLCCTFFPLPTAWIVMLLATRQAGFIDEAVWRVLVIAALGALATGLANLTEYQVWTFLLGYRRVGRLRRTRLFRWAADKFRVAPFAVLVGFSFIPIPVDVVRWLAVACGYSRVRFFGAYVLGRWVRYGLLAASTVWLELDWWHIVMVQGGLVVLAAGRFVMAHRGQAARAADGAAEDVTE